MGLLGAVGGLLGGLLGGTSSSSAPASTSSSTVAAPTKTTSGHSSNPATETSSASPTSSQPVAGTQPAQTSSQPVAGTQPAQTTAQSSAAAASVGSSTDGATPTGHVEGSVPATIKLNGNGESSSGAGYSSNPSSQGQPYQGGSGTAAPSSGIPSSTGGGIIDGHGAGPHNGISNAAIGVIAVLAIATVAMLVFFICRRLVILRRQRRLDSLAAVIWNEKADKDAVEIASRDSGWHFTSKDVESVVSIRTSHDTESVESTHTSTSTRSVDLFYQSSPTVVSPYRIPLPPSSSGHGVATGILLPQGKLYAQPGSIGQLSPPLSTFDMSDPFMSTSELRTSVVALKTVASGVGSGEIAMDDPFASLDDFPEPPKSVPTTPRHTPRSSTITITTPNIGRAL